VHPEDREFFNQHVLTYFDPERRTNSEELEFRIITRHGDVKWIGHACRAVFNKEGEFLGRRVSNRDITDRKQRELLLVQSNYEVKKLIENILQMLRIMSHDMRSPLISVAATLKLLQKGRFGQMDDSVANTVKDLVVRIRQILGIAEDCLGKASAVDAVMKIEKTEIDLRQEVIDVVLDELSNDIDARKIFIDNRLGAIPSGTIIVNASKMWLKVVYRNILKNAITYGRPGCTIAFGYEDHGEYYRLNVYNTGIPIPEDRRAGLFTKFGRVGEEGEGLREGVGMGLFLTKEIITQHGGNIWYEAKPGGNNFVFTLPES
jgi:signal transduction histidine kinase